MQIGKLQVIIIIIAIAAAIFAVLIFSGLLPGFGTFSPAEVKQISMWGSVEEDILARTLADLERSSRIEVSYQEKDPEDFEKTLNDALAAGKGPDVVIFSSDLILPLEDKLRSIPAASVSERAFRDAFADGTEILLNKNGEAIGLPFLIDPIVLYYNRDLFRNEAIALGPKTWDEFLSASQKLTKINKAGAITQAGAALGVETNVRHYKEIFSLLVLQTGAPLVKRGTLAVNFSPDGQQTDTVSSALRFYTDFANPKKVSYSWPRTMPPSDEAFSRELLAMYFAPASELAGIREKNPHLNFDIASVPQISGGKLNITYGKFLSLGVTRQSKDFTSGLAAIQFLASKDQLSAIAEAALLAPSRRDLLAGKPNSPLLETIYRETVKFRGWLDIDYQKTSVIFQEMIKSVYTGVKTEVEASRDAKIQLQNLYSN